jgi:hypothetical protein
VAGQADRGNGSFGGKPGACRNVKDAHSRRNTGGPQQERHKVRRDVRERLVV